MRWALAVLLAVAACGNDTPGIRLEIVAGDTATERVEVYLATHECKTCDGKLQPSEVTGKLQGDIWLLDNETMTPQTEAVLVAGSFVYDLRTPDSTTDVKLGYVVVVGYDANDTIVSLGRLTDIMLHHDRTEWYRLTLHDAKEQVSSDDPSPRGDRVWVWHRAEPDTAGCVGIEHATGDSVTREWLVPEDDTDCDSVPLTTDCDKFAYLADGLTDIGNASCATDRYENPGAIAGAGSGAPTPTCLLGGMACHDGATDQVSCGRVDPYYCLPDTFCTNASCTGANLTACSKLASTAHVMCDIPVATDGTSCPGVNTTATMMDLIQMFTIPGMPPMPRTRCTDVKFASVALGKPVTADTFTFNTAVISHGAVGAPCSFDIAWSGTGTSQTPVAFLDLTLENMSHALVPIVFEFHQSTCMSSEKMTCMPQIAPFDGLKHCAWY